ncbi:MAG TPA: glycosyltransferase [Candidatus Acidoferrales bacterium]|nr:glycosyltransferase [Candidatus Acidoferrales bacterium]
MRRPRLAVVASLVTPLLPAQSGGAQAFLSDLASGLAGRGWRVTVYCREGSRVPGVELAGIPVEGEHLKAALVRPRGGTATRVPALALGFERLFGELRRRGADLVSQHAFDAEAIELAEGLPVLHTLHLPPVVPAVVEAVRAATAPFAVPSESSRRGWAAAGLADPVVLRDGVPVFRPAPGPVQPVALVAGRISPEKGVAAAIRVARRAGLRPLVVGGAYDPAYFEAEVRPLLREGELLPAQSRGRLWRLMSQAAVSLLPIEWEEPFGLVAAESQMAGCPVVAYRRGALPEVVEEGVGGILVEPGDEEALLPAIAAARRLDRGRIHESAARRLALDATLDAYEQALEAVAS